MSEKEESFSNWSEFIAGVRKRYEEGTKFRSQILTELLAALEDPVKGKELKESLQEFDKFIVPDTEEDGLGCDDFNKATFWNITDPSLRVGEFIKPKLVPGVSAGHYFDYLWQQFVGHGFPAFRECRVAFGRNAYKLTFGYLNEIFKELREFRESSGGKEYSQMIKLENWTTSQRQYLGERIFGEYRDGVNIAEVFGYAKESKEEPIEKEEAKCDCTEHVSPNCTYWNNAMGDVSTDGTELLPDVFKRTDIPLTGIWEKLVELGFPRRIEYESVFYKHYKKYTVGYLGTLFDELRRFKDGTEHTLAEWMDAKTYDWHKDFAEKVFEQHLHIFQWGIHISIPELKKRVHRDIQDSLRKPEKPEPEKEISERKPREWCTSLRDLNMDQEIRNWASLPPQILETLVFKHAEYEDGSRIRLSDFVKAYMKDVEKAEEEERRKRRHGR
jgi:hypothetical protein